MTELTFSGYDAQGTDGSDLTKMAAVYQYGEHEVRIPAETPPEQVRNAVLQALDIDPTQEDARDAAITQIGATDVSALRDQAGAAQNSAAVADTVEDLREQVMAGLELLSQALELVEGLAVASGVIAPEV